MKWKSALSLNSDLTQALQECADQMTADGSTKPDLVIAFVSSAHLSQIEDKLDYLNLYLNPRHVIGCVSEGVIANDYECENKPALSLMAAWLDDVTIYPFSLSPDELAVSAQAPSFIKDKLQIDAALDPCFILLPNPFSFDVDAFLAAFDQAYPSCPKIGGLAFGGGQEGASFLFMDQHVYHHGLIGLALTGNFCLETLVAQGCRPIGTPLFVTEAEGNVIRSLDGKKPGEYLNELFETLDDTDQALFDDAVYLGLAMRSTSGAYGPGDFLIRHILGVDEENQSMAIASPVHQNQVVQFCVRDAKTSREDLEKILDDYAQQADTSEIKGALLFSCHGRGEYLYGQQHHDVRLFQKKLGPLPCVGFFANGEIGPVGGKSFVHGYTSCLGLVKQKTKG